MSCGQRGIERQMSVSSIPLTFLVHEKKAARATVEMHLYKMLFIQGKGEEEWCASIHTCIHFGGLSENIFAKMDSGGSPVAMLHTPVRVDDLLFVKRGNGPHQRGARRQKGQSIPLCHGCDFAI